MKKNKGNRYSGIGGQAVLEGVMMKNKDKYAVAVRKPDGVIDVEVDVYQGIMEGSVLKKVPFVRGIFNFLDSMVLGMRSLNHSVSFYEDGEAQETAADKVMGKLFREKAENVMLGMVTVFSIVLAVAIFMVLPYFISSLFEEYIRNTSVMAILEGVIRILIFVGYIVAITMMKDIRRLYQYHGAEHKCINCMEKGRPLTVHNVMRSSRLHKRCGTSFLFFVVFVSIIVFFFIRVEQPVLRVLLRIALIPVIAGISYEIIRLAGRSNNIFVRILSAPGMWLQKLTTKEPDREMAEVAIASVEAVFDWKAYLKETFGYEVDDSWLVDEPSEDGEDENANGDGYAQMEETEAAGETVGREPERKGVSGKEEKAKRETLGKEGKKEVRIKERVELEETEKHEKPELELETELEKDLETELEIEEIGDETEEAVIRKETEWKAATEIKPQPERNRKAETAVTEAAMKVWQEENVAEEPEGRREGGNEI